MNIPDIKAKKDENGSDREWFIKNAILRASRTQPFLTGAFVFAFSV